MMGGIVDSFEGEFRVMNAFEGVIELCVRGLIKKDPEFCRCDRCLKDVCAIVANAGYYRFVTTEQGKLIATLPEISEKREAEIMFAALEAMETVKKRPNHGGLR